MHRHDRRAAARLTPPQPAHPTRPDYALPGTRHPADAPRMGDTHSPHRCLECDTDDDTVVFRGYPFGPRCRRCWHGIQNQFDNVQALEDGATAPGPPAAPRCPDCDLIQDRHETGYQRWVLLEPRIHLPAHAARILPAGQRWFIGDDGLAINTRDEPFPAARDCRIPHAFVCPCRAPDPAPPDPALTMIREENERRYEREHPPGMPDSDTG